MLPFNRVSRLPPIGKRHTKEMPAFHMHLPATRRSHQVTQTSKKCPIVRHRNSRLTHNNMKIQHLIFAPFHAAAHPRLRHQPNALSFVPRQIERHPPSWHASHGPDLTTLAYRPYDEISRFFLLGADFARPAFAQNGNQTTLYVRDISI
jgi:hypothetical protein